MEVIFRITTTNEIGKEEEYLEIKGSDYFDLLKYLIRNGYLDESYADYMTYFYEDSLSRTDKIFLRSVTDKKAKEYGYALKDPKLVLSRLHPLDFDQPEALNYCMLDYLLEHASDSPHLAHLVGQLKNTANYTFVAQYYDVARSKTLFVIWLNKLWPTFFKEALEGNHLNPVQLKEYSVLTLCYSQDEEVAAANEENLLTNYVSNDAGYLNIENPQIEKLLHAFHLLNVSFRCFAPTVAETELFRAVYRDGLYELNFENIQFILQYQYHFSDTEDILHKNYSLILTNMMSSLYVKIQENMSAYIDIILGKCGRKITDSENVIREVLNCDHVERDQKEQYIMCVVNPIVHLKMITDKSIWKLLVSSAVLDVNEINIVEYFLHVRKLDQDLVGFINRSTRKLDYSSINKQYRSDDLESLFDAVVICEELSDQKYMESVMSLGFRYDEFNVANISSTKMIILIDNEIVEMNKATLAFIRENYGKDVVLRYVLAHISDYADLVDENTFDYDELIAVLDSEVDDMYKLRLLELADAPISIKNRKYSVPVCVHILEHNLDQNDMRTLFAQYDSLNVLIQNVVFNYAIKNMGYTTDNAQIIDTKLLQLIFESTDVSDEEKAVLLSEIMSKLNQEEISEYLVKMGMDNYLIINVLTSNDTF